MRSLSGWKSRLWLFQLSVLPSILLAQQHFVPPPNLNLENLPNTTFSCEGKVVGGYYADVDTGCQMFHVCTLGQKGETQDIKFLCLQGTVFAQETRVCERTEEVNCQGSGDFYDINKELYHNSNKIHLEFDGNVTDSASEASITHVFLPYEADYSDTDRFQDDYQDDFSQQYRGRSTDYRGRTRSEVPLFNSRRTEQRSTHSLPPPQVQPFSRFRQTRRFGGRISTPFPSAVSTSPAVSAPSTEAAAASPVVSSTIAVPLIPVKNPDGPHVVVTNGKPFVPKLDASDPAPTLQQESEYHSLALPDTNFTCADKVSGGHYADPETDCRMFHICVMGPNETITDYKLLCGNNTVFEQKSRTCQEIEKVDCASSVLNYYVNNHLIVPKWLENAADNQRSQAANLNAQIKALNDAQLIVTERMAASTAAIGSQSAAVGDSDGQSALGGDTDGQTALGGDNGGQLTPGNITSSSNEPTTAAPPIVDYHDPEYYSDYVDYYFDYDYPDYYVSSTERSPPPSASPAVSRTSRLSVPSISRNSGPSTSGAPSHAHGHRSTFSKL